MEDVGEVLTVTLADPVRDETSEAVKAWVVGMGEGELDGDPEGEGESRETATVRPRVTRVKRNRGSIAVEMQQRFQDAQYVPLALFTNELGLNGKNLYHPRNRSPFLPPESAMSLPLSFSFFLFPKFV